MRLRGEVAETKEIAGNGVEMTVNFTVEIYDSDTPACVARAVSNTGIVSTNFSDSSSR